MKTRLIFLLVIFILIAGPNISTAATIFWVGGSSTSWTKNTNWSGSVVPGSSDAVYIGGGTTYAPKVDGAYSCSSLTITSSVTLTLAGNLTVSGAITNTYGTVNFTIATGSGYTLSAGSISYNGSGAVITVGSSNNLVLTGALTLGYSTSLSNSGNVTVTSSANPAVTLTGGGGYIKNITATSHFTINGSMSPGNGSVINNVGFFTIVGNIVSSGGVAITNSGTFDVSACAYITNNADTFVNSSGGIVYLYGNSSWDYTGGGSITNSGTFYAGKTGSACTLNMGNYGSSITNNSLFYLGSTSVIGFKNGTSINTNSNTVTNNSGGTFTIQSDINGTGTIAQSSGNACSGTFNVQRYITGNGVNANYLGYRMLTSPVNINNAISQTSSSPGYISLSYLGAGMETGGPLGSTNGFDATTTNPLIYFYAEPRTQSYATYIGGKNVGVYAINSTTVTTYGTTSAAMKTTASVPVGNSYQIFFVGTPTDGINASIPHAATVTAVGTLNQGTIPVQVFNGATSSVTMTYTTGTGATVAGLSQVGNPYASTIDLDSVYYDNKTTLSSIFYMMTTPGTAFVTYNAASHTASSTFASPYIASGQGFFAGALPTTSSLTFYEKEKVNVILTAATTPPLDLNQRLKAAKISPAHENITAAEEKPNGLAGLHLQLTQDALTYTQTGIYFSKSWSDKYVGQEDAIDMDAASPVVYLSSYSSDGTRLSINQMGDYTKGKVVKLYTAAVSSGTFTISLADASNIDPLYNVYLRDHHLNDSLDLRSIANYSFTINKSDTSTYGANRFDLVIEAKQLAPYALVSFLGQKVTAGVQLRWNVSNAGTYTDFVLQRKRNDGSFSPIYTTQSNNNTVYSFVDTAPVVGNNTYRLAQSDFYGNITYSSPVTIGYNNVSSNGYFSIYPNPAKNIVNVLVNSTSSALSTTYTADIYSTSGTLMDHRLLNTNTWTEDFSAYREGVYIIALKNTNGDMLGLEKLIKVK